MPLVHRDLGYHFPIYKEGSAGSGVKETQYWKRIRCTVNITDGDGAATEDILGVLVAPHRMIVVAAWVVPTEVTVVFNAANYATWTLYNMGRTGGAIVHTIGAIDSSVASLVTDTVTAMTLTAYGAGADVEFESRIIERGEFVKIELSKHGAGVVAGNVCVEMITKAIEGHI